jgi:hypothetical protein
MGGGIEAGKAFIKFLLEDKEFKKGLTGIATRMKKFGAIGTAVSAPIVAGFGAAVAAFTSAGDELAKMSTRTGFSVESLSELKYAADQSGTSIGSIERATKKMQVGLLDAAKGTGALFESLGPLGLSLDELQKMSPEQQFLALSRAIASVEDPSQRAALAQKVFGKSGTDLLPMLADGAAGLDQLRQRAHDLGLTMDGDTANSAVVLGDNIEDLKKQFFQLAVNIGAAVAGPLNDFLMVAQDIMSWVLGFIKENPGLVRGIGYIATAVAAASAAALTFGTILAIISAHPIIAALAGIAALALLVARYFGLIGDNAKGMKKGLDEIKGASASIPDVNQKKLDSQAEGVKQQLQAAVNQSPAVTGANHAAGLESTFVRRALEEISRNTGESAKHLKDLVTLARTGEAGFFYAGTG